MYRKDATRNKRNWRSAIYRSTQESKARRKMLLWCGLTIKSIKYGLTELGNWLSQNVQDIWRSYNIHWGNHEKLEGGIDCRKNNFSWGQRDSLSPLQFALTTMPLSHIHWKCTGCYNLHKSQENVNYLMYMDDIKLFVKNEKELETLKQAVRI